MPVRCTTPWRLTTPSRVRFAEVSSTRRALTSLSIRASCQGSRTAQPAASASSSARREAPSAQRAHADRAAATPDAPPSDGDARGEVKLDLVEPDQPGPPSKPNLFKRIIESAGHATRSVTER